jgi:hypothetical protein
MKLITGLFLILLYTVALLRPVAPLVDYVINQELITEEFCENKKLPELECNGKCYLAKQLKKVNPDQSNPIQLNINWNDYPIGFVSILKVNFEKTQKLKSNQYCIKKMGATNSYINQSYSPPENC